MCGGGSKMACLDFSYFIRYFFHCRLARQFTGKEDIVVVEDSFHGNLGVLIDISPKMYQYIPNYRQKEYVHITPLPSR